MTETSVLRAALADFPADIGADIRRSTLNNGIVNAKSAALWLTQLNVDVEQLMMRLLPVAAAYSRAPISRFHVGAVALGNSADGLGNLYLGANMEFVDCTLGDSVHAEQAAVNSAWLHGETSIAALAVNAPPCGYCRQFLAELGGSVAGLDILMWQPAAPGSLVKQSMADLLPNAFGPSDLGLDGHLMAPADHALSIQLTQPLAQAAVHAANASYAPYSKDYSGVALKCTDGEIYTGRYAENAAYNPSLSPMASALSAMNMSLLPQTSLAIDQAVLAETGEQVKQAESARSLLASVAPAAAFDVIAIARH